MRTPLLLALLALPSPSQAGIVAAAEAGEASLVPRIGSMSSPLLSPVSFAPALGANLSHLAAPSIIPLAPTVLPVAAAKALTVSPVHNAGVVRALTPVLPAASVPETSGLAKTALDAAASFDGASFALKDALSFPRSPGADGMISVAYGRPDWMLKVAPFGYESFASAAAEHRAAVRAGSADADGLGLRVTAAYSAVLQNAGVKVLPTHIVGRDGVGSIGILLLPDPRGHRLNRVAARLAAAGVKMIFSPRVTAMNPARFEITNTGASLYLPNLDLGWPGEALRHELRHFGFFKRLLLGQISLLHAYFTPKPGRMTADDARIYGEYLALEEVATYAHQVRGMLRIVAENPAPEAIEELKAQLAGLREVARIARGLIAEARAETEAGTAVLTSSPIGERSAFLNVELSRGRLAFGVSPHEVAGEYSSRLALKRRLDAWDVLLDGVEPLAAAIKAELDGAPAPDRKALKFRGDFLSAAITKGDGAWR